MKRISSGRTWFWKRLFPAIWFGFLGLFLVLAVFGVLAKRDEGLFVVPFLAIPLVMAALGVFLMRKLVWDLVDEVDDCGDHLVVKARGESEKVPLADVMNVSASSHTSPPRITLRLVKAGRFGSEIAFIPDAPLMLDPFARNPIAEDLIVRVDRARSDRRT